MLKLNEDNVYEFLTDFCFGVLDADRYGAIHQGKMPFLPSERRLFAEQFCETFTLKNKKRGKNNVNTNKR